MVPATRLLIEDIFKEVFIGVPVGKAFKAWTSADAVRCWFAPAAQVEPRVDGRFELFFDPDNRNEDSTTGCRFIQFEQDRLLEFDWKGPMHLAESMNQGELTRVRVDFEPIGNTTRIKLRHAGWGDSAEWKRGQAWHAHAWDLVLGRLKKWLENQP